MKNLFCQARRPARRISALALSALMLVSTVKLSVPASAAEADEAGTWTDPAGVEHDFGDITGDGLCYHHQTHADTCGYQEAHECEHMHTPGGCFIVISGTDTDDGGEEYSYLRCKHDAGEHKGHMALGRSAGSCDHVHDESAKNEDGSYECDYDGTSLTTCTHYGTGHDETCFDNGEFVCQHCFYDDHDVGSSCADENSGRCPHDDDQHDDSCGYKSPHECEYVCTQGCIPATKIELSLGKINFYDAKGNPVSNPLQIPYENVTGDTVHDLVSTYLPKSATVTMTIRAYVMVDNNGQEGDGYREYYDERITGDPLTWDIPLSLNWNETGSSEQVANGSVYHFTCKATLPNPYANRNVPDSGYGLPPMDEGFMANVAKSLGWPFGEESDPDVYEELYDAYDDFISDKNGNSYELPENVTPQFHISVYGYENGAPAENNGYVEVSSLNDLVTYIQTETANGKKELALRLVAPTGDDAPDYIFGGHAVTIPQGCKVTLDLNGQRLVYTNEDTSLGTPALFNVESGATLTIEDSKMDTVTKTSTTEGIGNNLGQLGSYSNDGVLTYYVTKSTADGTLATTKYTVDMSQTGMLIAMNTRNVILVNAGGTLNFNGGRITNANSGHHGIRSEGGNVTIDGGLLVGTGSVELPTPLEEGPTAGDVLAPTDSGAGIYCNGGSLLVTGSSYIAGNRTLADGNGAGIYATNMSTFRITGDAVIAGNLSQFGGGGVFVNESTTLTIDGNAVIAGNLAAYNGGGVYVEKWEDFDNSKRNSLTISGNAVITNNVAGRMLADTSEYGAGGGGVYAGGKKITLEGNIQITGNWAYDSGGGILIGYGRKVSLANKDKANLPEFTMTGGIIAGNQAGVKATTSTDQDGKVTINRTLATVPNVEEDVKTNDIRNSATTGSEGGGIRLEGKGEIKGGSIVNNKTLTEYDFGGGGIFIESYGSLTIWDAVITNNNAKGYGGGVAACTNGTVKIGDGKVAIYGNTVQGKWQDGEGKSIGDITSHGLTTNTLELGDGWPEQAEITENGNTTFAKDYFGARHSEISGTMLGGGDAGWTGYMGGTEDIKDPEKAITAPAEKGDKALKTVSVVGSGVNTVTESTFDVYSVTIPLGGSASASKLMALTSGYNGAAPAHKVTISGNTSATHGGGIACNGTLIFAATTPVTPQETPKTPKTGSLTVTKTVTKNPDDETEFTFTLTLSESGSYSYIKYGADGSQVASGSIGDGDQFTLSDGQRIVISNLPENTAYTVTEEGADGYTMTSTGSEGTISTSGVTAAFINAKIETGSLTIRKFVDDPADVLNGAKPEFNFTVTFPDAEGEYALTYSTDREGRSDFKSGDTVTLAGGEAAAISGLPAGTEFTVTEVTRGDLGTYTVTTKNNAGGSSGETIRGEIQSGRTVTIDVTNSFPKPETGSLIIRKTVTGTDADLDKEFTFRVTFKDEDGKPLDGEFPCTGSRTGTISSGGTFRLSHGKFLRITDLPIGTQYTVVEEDGNRGAYVTGRLERSGTIGEVEAVASYTNHKPDVPRYVDEDGTPYIKVPDPEDPEEEIWIEDEDPPLAQVEIPETGDASAVWLALTLTSALGLLLLGIDRKRRQDMR